MTDEPDGDEADRDLAILKRHAAQLMEMFDSVHLFCTRQQRGDDGGETVACNWGHGNWYSRYGQIQEWTVRQDERIREHQRQSDREDEE